MTRYSVESLHLLGDCQPASEVAEKLFFEECFWVCKHRRPFVRCLMAVDPTRQLVPDGHFEHCAFRETCEEESESRYDPVPVTVEATCRSVTNVHALQFSALQLHVRVNASTADATSLVETRLADLGAAFSVAVGGSEVMLTRLLSAEAPTPGEINLEFEISATVVQAIDVLLRLPAVEWSSALGKVVGNPVHSAASSLRRLGVLGASRLELASAAGGAVRSMKAYVFQHMEDVARQTEELQEAISQALSKQNVVCQELELARSQHASLAKDLATLRATDISAAIEAGAAGTSALEEAVAELSEVYAVYAVSDSGGDTARFASLYPRVFNTSEERTENALSRHAQAVSHVEAARGKLDAADRAIFELSVRVQGIRRLLWEFHSGHNETQARLEHNSADALLAAGLKGELNERLSAAAHLANQAREAEDLAAEAHRQAMEAKALAYEADQRREFAEQRAQSAERRARDAEARASQLGGWGGQFKDASDTERFVLSFGLSGVLGVCLIGACGAIAVLLLRQRKRGGGAMREDLYAVGCEAPPRRSLVVGRPVAPDDEDVEDLEGPPAVVKGVPRETPKAQPDFFAKGGRAGATTAAASVGFEESLDLGAMPQIVGRLAQSQAEVDSEGVRLDTMTVTSTSSSESDAASSAASSESESEADLEAIPVQIVA